MPFTMTSTQNLPEHIESARRRLLAALAVLNGMAGSPYEHGVYQARKALAEAGRGLQNLSHELEMLGLQLGERRDQEAAGGNGARHHPLEMRETPFTD